jgi:hypothetical protein
MYTIHVWWAGHRLSRQTRIVDMDEAQSALDAIQHRLDHGLIELTSCGVRMVPDAVCVDVLQEGKLVATHDFYAGKD